MKDTHTAWDSLTFSPFSPSLHLLLFLSHTHTHSDTHTHTYATGMPMRQKESEHEAMQQFDCSGLLPRQNPNATATVYC